MKKTAIGIAAVLIVAFALIAMTGRMTSAQNGAEEDTMAKLDTIIDNQKTILEGIEFLKQEINIVKIRVTQNQ